MSFISQQDNGLTISSSTDVQIGLPTVTSGTGNKLEIKHGSDVAARFENKNVSLYHDGIWRLKTTNKGVTINTECHATSFHGDGANLDMTNNDSVKPDRLTVGTVVKVLATTAGADVTGTIKATGDVIAFSSSDERLKDNLKLISDPLEKISKMSGYEFDWNDKQDTYTGHDVGVVAQEIEQVLPEVVTERDDGYKAVKYEKLVPLLIESIKELSVKVEELESKLK